MPLNGFYKLVPKADSVKTVSKYVKEGNCWPNNRTIDEYESVFWRGIDQPGWVFEYAQELAPKPADAEWKPALGALLTFQPMDAASGGMDAPIEGVTSFYMYLRRAGAFLPPHTENAELFSISLLLPKSDCNALTIWYSIPAADFTRFKNLAASVFVNEFSADPEYLRAKTIMISPEILRQNNIRCTRTGVNTAIAWNVGPLSWAAYGLDSKPGCSDFFYPVIDTLELIKKYILRQKGVDGDEAIAQEQWNELTAEIVNYGEGFDSIYPFGRPTQTNAKKVVPPKYIQLGGHWFRAEHRLQQTSGIREGIRYRCCTCRRTLLKMSMGTGADMARGLVMGMCPWGWGLMGRGSVYGQVPMGLGADGARGLGMGMCPWDWRADGARGLVMAWDWGLMGLGVW
ncbi:hypothetical protein niasHT_035781 [Heterodera trifolii]|uniref:JmjC domain-containing protein n=1 Tax=Heterodera trifolii TaxID=157864 RepID=A0ABD2ISF6_9BILA